MGFMENVFRDGEIKTAGTDIDKLMPLILRFGGSRTENFIRKEVIIQQATKEIALCGLFWKWIT